MMYADWPMRGYGLMQAIAHVNRVFRDKQGGLTVDYLGLAVQMKQALATCTESNPQHRSSECQEIKSARRGGAETSMGLSRRGGAETLPSYAQFTISRTADATTGMMRSVLTATARHR